jgi:uncharacterized damage-inducible protein DinB
MPLIPYQLSLRHSPAILQRLVAQIPKARFAEPGTETRFSILEMVCHIADFETVFFDRIRAAVETDVPQFASVDISARVIEQRYADQNLDEQLTKFAEGRKTTIAYLESLDDTQLARELIQSFGRMTVKEFVSVMAGHDVYHIEQLTGYLEGKR